jgi:zinc protease
MTLPKTLFVLVAVCLLTIAGLGFRDGVCLTAQEPGPSGTSPAAGSQATGAAPRVPSPASDVAVTKLDNGLTVILKSTDLAPVVSVRCYVRAGGMHEREFLGCGLSHLLEHLVAQEAIHQTAGGGAPQAGQKPKRSRTLEIGGQSNAYTTLDHACYYISASSSKTMECIDLIADQMARPAFTEKDFQREHQVVQRELEMGKDDAPRQLWYAHAANVFRTHPAGVPVIGFAPALADVTWKDVKTYHARMYVPQNMVFVVVGDIDKSAALAKIREEFADFPAGREPDVSLPEVPVVSGTRVVTQPHPATRDVSGRISFQTIPLLHEDLYPLDVLSFILSRGRNSRLYQRLILGKLAVSVQTSSWTPAWGKGIFTVSYRCEPEKVEQVEAAIYEELRKVVKQGVTADELERSKRQKRAEMVYDQQTAESQAGMYGGDYLSTGNLRFTPEYVQRIQDVTAGQVQAMARKYFRFEDKVVTRLVPPGELAEAERQSKDRTETDAELLTLKNGLRVILKPTDSVGLVAMTLTTKGGVLRESKDNNGIGSLMMAATTRGAGGRSADEIAAFFDAAGGSIEGNCGNNSFYWQATVLEDSFAEAVKILADVVVRPAFPEKEINVLRPLLETQIARSREHWLSNAHLVFRQKFFGPDAGYGLHPMGREEVLTSLDAADLKAWHRKNVLAGQSVLAIYGNFDLPQARQLIGREFRDMPAGREPIQAAPQEARARRDDAFFVEEKPDQKQAAVVMGVAGMKIDNLDDRLAITVMDTILSGYRLPSGWLHTQLRGEGLVYVVHAYNWAGLVPGTFMAYAGCEPDQASRVVSIMHEKFNKAADYTPTEQEVRQAVNIILTADVLDNQTMASLSMSASLDELYGLGYDFHKNKSKLYGRVTPADVHRVGKKYFSRGLVTLVTTPKPGVLLDVTDAGGNP